MSKVGGDDRAKEYGIYDARVNNMDAAFEAIVEVALSTTSSQDLSLNHQLVCAYARNE